MEARLKALHSNPHANNKTWPHFVGYRHGSARRYLIEFNYDSFLVFRQGKMKINLIITGGGECIHKKSHRRELTYFCDRTWMIFRKIFKYQFFTYVNILVRIEIKINKSKDRLLYRIFDYVRKESEDRSIIIFSFFS